MTEIPNRPDAKHWYQSLTVKAVLAFLALIAARLLGLDADDPNMAKVVDALMALAGAGAVLGVRRRVAPFLVLVLATALPSQGGCGAGYVDQQLKPFGMCLLTCGAKCGPILLPRRQSVAPQSCESQVTVVIDRYLARLRSTLQDKATEECEGKPGCAGEAAIAVDVHITDLRGRLIDKHVAATCSESRAPSIQSPVGASRARADQLPGPCVAMTTAQALERDRPPGLGAAHLARPWQPSSHVRESADHAPGRRP